MGGLHLELDDSLVEALVRAGNGQSPARTARELLVLELYRRSVISVGRAAELLDMRLLDFIEYSGAQGIAHFRMSEAGWQAEVERASAL